MAGVSDGHEPARDEARRRTARIAVPALSLLGLLILVNLLLWRDVDRLQDDLGGVQEQLAASDRDVATLSSQVGQLKLEAFDPAAVGSKVGPSVFQILAPSGKRASVGTGFVMGKRGRRSLLVTNFHVLRGVQDVEVSQGDRRYEGRVLQEKPAEDLASIEIDADLPVLRAALTPARVGDPVVVVGSAIGLEGTLTTGAVSAVDREIEGQRWLQFSAPVNPGNSGGPVVNKQGEVVGVATFKAVSRGVEGLGFAIPLARVCNTLGVC